MSKWRPDKYASITLKRIVYYTARNMMREYGMHSVAHVVDNALKLYVYVQEQQPGLMREANVWCAEIEKEAAEQERLQYSKRTSGA